MSTALTDFGAWQICNKYYFRLNNSDVHQVPANVHGPRRRLSHQDGRLQSLHGLCSKLHALSLQGEIDKIIVGNTETFISH